MDKSISNKIKYLYLILTIGMVMYHGSWVDRKSIHYLNIIDHKSLFLYLRFASHIGIVCMVFFFFMSGFWLYKGLNTKEELIKKIKKRFKTLLIPFLLWSFIILIYKITCDGLIFKFKDLFYLLFQHPVAGPLWYTLGLLILLVFSPMILYIKKYKRITAIIFLIVSIYIFLRNFNVIPKFLHFSNWWWYENLLFYIPVYLLGSYFGLYYNNLLIQKEYKERKFTIIGIVLLIIAFFLWYLFKEVNYNLEIFYSLIELVGIWFVFKPSLSKKDIPQFLNCNYYIFALHNPILLPRTQKLINMFVDSHRVFGIEMAIIKVIQILVVIIIAILVKVIVTKLLPKKISYYFTGGR